MAHGLRSLAALALCALVVLDAPGARAANPTVNVEVFRPSTHQGDLVTVQGTNLPDDSVWTTSLTTSYSRGALTFVDAPTGKRAEVVKERLTLDLMGSFSLFKWVDIGLALPVHLVNTGERDFTDSNIADFASAGLGDIRLSPKVRILHRGEDDQGFGLAIDSLFVLPTGDPEGFASDGFSWQPSVIADLKWGGLHLAANVGFRLRDHQELIFLGISHELSFGLGASYRIVGETNSAVTVRGVDFDMMVEMHGATCADPSGCTQDTGREDATTGEPITSPTAFTPEGSHIEGILAGRVAFPDIGLSATLGGGSGWLLGYGNVKFRVFFGASFAMPHNRDYDEDGILDEDDACQEQPEDFDGHEDADGCPEPDNDGDKIDDAVDRCPNDAEDFDKFEDTDGCPDLDNDGDTIRDNKDKCPLEPEDRDGYQDADGCPDPDNDGDGLKDIADRCPDSKETINGYQDDDGCPDESLAKVESGRIVILDKVYFETKEAELMPQSFPVLRAVAGILRVTPAIKKVRIEGHTDDKGSNRKNLKLSQARAEAVMAFLLREGVRSGRLEAVGHGEEQPAVKGRKDEARDANRRVEFVIVEQ